MNILQVADLGVKIHGQWVLKNIHFEIAQGEIVTLIGPNGSGKTTLLRAILGLQHLSRGEVKRSDGLTIGYMPQRWHIDPTLPLTVKRFLQLSDVGLDETFLGHLNIDPLMPRQMSMLSGGEMQRVLLAKALLRRPNFLVLDEPAQGVDIAGQSKLYALIDEASKTLRCSVLMVSHDLHLVMANTDKVICLNQHICCSGSPESVQKDPQYLNLFGRDASMLALYTHEHDHTHDGQ